MANFNGVSSRVSHGVSQAEGAPAAPKRPKRRGSGPYLVASGRSYLFQIKLPKTLGGGRGSKPVRLSLGPIPRTRARVLADRLAALAREQFEQLRRLNDMGRPDDDRPFDPDQETEDEYLARIGAPAGFEADLLFPGGDPAAQVTGALRQALRSIEGAMPDGGPHENLKAISRELSRKHGGLPHNEMIVDSADLLRERYVAEAQRAHAATVGAELADRDPAEPAASPPAAASVSPVEHPALDGGDARPAIVHEADAPAETVPTAAGNTAEHPPAIALSAAPVPGTAELLDPLWQELRPGPDAFTTLSLPDGRAPSFLLDRRRVPRPDSSKPLFSSVSDDHIEHLISLGSDARYLNRVRMYRELFLDFIGDHPADSYTASDFQAYIEFLRYWPAKETDRRPDLTPREMVRANIDLSMRPLAKTTLEGIAVGCIKTAITRGGTTYDYRSPVAGIKLTYPNTAPLPKKSAPLSFEKINTLFRTGCESGHLDNAMLPLLGFTTGRRLAVLVNLHGSDFEEKFPGVWVAQLGNIKYVDGHWRRIAIKTPHSTTYFVLHDVLREIGFIDWAVGKGDDPLFPELRRLADPARSASSYMSRLFQKAGIARGNHEEVFHSLRGGYIEIASDGGINGKSRRLQVGHATGGDEHDDYGFQQLSEAKARQLVKLQLPQEIEFSVFEDLDFEAMYRQKRTRGRRIKSMTAKWGPA